MNASPMKWLAGGFAPVDSVLTGNVWVAVVGLTVAGLPVLAAALHSMASTALDVWASVGCAPENEARVRRGAAALNRPPTRPATLKKAR